ncbi:DUF2461 domain-containing protein [uncultured Jannaschia sp.]|uniref:DUF2461 domain-containing protein n=1 Tax=uncultured Jannaschia sp. TaxID=293347 RepID=UPI002604AADD|nr:DUF2461 domain-containing protein [uncultured Jannaschia sp.]
MIDPRTFEFLSGLKTNNTKEWFTDHRADYEDAKANLVEVAAKLTVEVARFDEAIRQTGFDPAMAVTRMNRDMRFTKDKTPYKTDFFVMVRTSPHFQRIAGYSIHIEPGGSYASAGIFRTERGPLSKIRDRISGRFAEWKAIVESPEVRRMFPDGFIAPNVLKNGPKGYDKDDPAIEYLKLEGFSLNHRMTDAEMSADGALSEWVSAHRTASPLVEFINKAVVG